MLIRSRPITILFYLLVINIFCPAGICADEEKDFIPLLTPEEDESEPFIPPRGDSIARLLNIRKLVNELDRQLTKDRKNSKDEISNRTVYLKLHLADVIQFATLQVQDVITKIDLNLVESNRILERLNDQRTKSNQRKNMATFMTSGALSILSSSLAFAGGSSNKVLGLMSGSSSTALPTANFYHRKIEFYQLTSSGGNILAQIFGMDPIKDNQINSTVWSYLNSVPPNKKMSRVQLLRSRWYQTHIKDCTKRFRQGITQFTTFMNSTRNHRCRMAWEACRPRK